MFTVSGDEGFNRPSSETQCSSWSFCGCDKNPLTKRNIGSKVHFSLHLPGHNPSLKEVRARSVEEEMSLLHVLSVLRLKFYHDPGPPVQCWYCTRSIVSQDSFHKY